MNEADEHVPALVRWANRHTVPAEVCLGCSDTATGHWVPVTFCERAKLVSIRETVYLEVQQPEDWDELDETTWRLARANRWAAPDLW